MKETEAMKGTVIRVTFLCVISCTIPALVATQFNMFINNFGSNIDYHPDLYFAVGYSTGPQYSGIYDVDTAIAFTPSGYNYILSKIELGLNRQREINDRIDMRANESLPRVQNVNTGATYDTIQEAINDASDSDTLIANEGVHYPPDSYGINFLGKEITLRSSNPNDPDVVMATVIDCLGDGRGFYFHNGEDPNSVLDGFTIMNGYNNIKKQGGGAIYCDRSSPTIKNCIMKFNQAWKGGAVYFDNSSSVIENCQIVNNISNNGGGGVHCDNSEVKIINCEISNNIASVGGGIFFDGGNSSIDGCIIKNNSPDGIWLELDTTVEVFGITKVINNDLMGQGTLHIHSGSILDLDNAEVFCDVTGLGTMIVDIGTVVIIDGNAIIDLQDPYDPNLKGTIDCGGLLHVKDNATITNANINLSQAIFEDNATLTRNIIQIDKTMPYGQVYIDPNITFTHNDIYADGDRYMDLEPAIFDGNFINCRIFVTITEGANDTRGGLFECRGEPGLTDVNSCDLDNTFFCLAETGTIPDCNTKTWTLERLELTPGAKLNLTNRFPFQPPYDPGTDYDVVYVKELILREGAILNTSYNNIYYQTLVVEPNALVKNEPLLGFSMINIAFDDETEFLARVTHNNFTHPSDPNFDRIHIDRVEGLIPDPNGMMLMQNLLGQDPTETLNARVKGLFSKSSEDEVLVRFEYLFETADPNVELVAFLSNTPELGDYNDPNSYYEVARILPPPIGQPGSLGSGRFGVFEEYVPTGGLDFVIGTRIELLLLGPAGTSVYINNWDPQVLCDGICLDLNWSATVDEEDFLLVVGNCGASTGLDSGGQSYVCLEVPFGSDGTVDSHDIFGWDWLLNDSARQNLCGSLPLTGGVATSVSSSVAMAPNSMIKSMSYSSADYDDLLLGGKKGTTDAITKLQDGIYVFNETGVFSQALAPVSERGNIRLVDDFEGNVYVVNSETGVSISGDPNGVIIAPRSFTGISEPRYSSSASVYVGSQEVGGDTYGRPILDAAFDVNFSTNNYVYVVPIVVDPAANDPYLASAKLQLTGGGSYTIVHIYDDPNATDPGDNRELDALREIETDSFGSVYVINAHALNESDTLWRYNSSTGAMDERLTLGNSASSSYVPAPSGLHASRFEEMLYLGSSLSLPNANSISVYGFSTDGSLGLTRTINITGMGHIGDITDNPISGTLWIAGFCMDPPEYPNPYAQPFYEPYLAQVPMGATDVSAVSTLTADSNNTLAMPLSIVWTGPLPEKCGGADLDGSGTVELKDFAKIGEYWSDTDCASSNNCEGADLEPENEPDGDVDLADLAVLIEHWLESGCSN